LIEKVKFFPFFFLLFFTQKSFAGPCCAANGAIPSMIVTDEKMQFSLNFALGSVFGWANRNTHIVPESSKETLRTLSLDGSFMISEQTQIGMSIPYMRKSLDNPHTNSDGLSDIRINSVYEISPEYTYSAWKPRSFTFLQVTFPTGTSSEKAVLPNAIDAFGEGRTSFSTGLLFLKAGSVFDGYFLPQASIGLANFYRTSLYRLSSLFGLGLNIKGFRFGVRIDPVYQFAHKIKKSSFVILPKLTTGIGIEVSYMINKKLSIRCMAADQSYLHLSFNTSIARSISFGMIYKIPQ
jgi:hypothetical protein